MQIGPPPSSRWILAALLGSLSGVAGTAAAIGSCPSLPTTPIPAIQGSGASAAISGGVTTEGVVIGDYELPTGSGQLRGFYLQDVAGDGDPATSDGLFVYMGGADAVSVGDFVRVTGAAGEFQGQTQITATTLEIRGTGSVAPVDVTLPFPSGDFPERYEGMLVRFPQPLFVTEHFQLGRFGQIVVSSGGRLVQPTSVVAPGAPALAMQATNELNRLIVDDATNAQNPDPILLGRGGLPLSASNTLRGGDGATGLAGVLTYGWSGNSASGNAWRLRPFGALGGMALFDATSPRPGMPVAPAPGVLRVASLNLLNFFDTFGSVCTLGIGGAITSCRGAESAAELARQQAKTGSAILGTSADVLAAIEIENDGYGASSALRTLVDGLNAATAPGTWALIDADAATGQTNALGTDAIKVALLHRPERVTPVGRTAVLNDVAFVNAGDSSARNRPALAQAFQSVAGGERFIVSVNHLKSRGSACDAPDAGDGQGNCNLVRARAAAALVSWLASDPTGTGDPDVLIVGDLNAYATEDPLGALRDGGYVDLAASFAGAGAYSYAFDGQWGALDHALATPSLAAQALGVLHWHIHADEPSVLDYNLNFKSAAQAVGLFAPDAYRASDHDPLLVDLALAPPPLDADGDGVPDAADNCPFAANGPNQAGVPGVGDQTDRGGLGAGAAPDGIGDACQCGDVTGDGRVTLADAVSVQRALLVPPTIVLAHPERCDVGAGAGCGLGDAVLLRRALLAPPAATLQPLCEPALP